MSVETIRRYLKADRFPNARRATPGTASCPWRIPETDLTNAGLILRDDHPATDHDTPAPAAAATPRPATDTPPPPALAIPLDSWVGQLLEANQALIAANSRLSADNAQLAARCAELAGLLAAGTAAGHDHLRRAS